MSQTFMIVRIATPESMMWAQMSTALQSGSTVQHGTAAVCGRCIVFFGMSNSSKQKEQKEKGKIEEKTWT